MKHVEILLATFNGEPYLSEQLDSILSQDAANWHLTVSDDGSTDQTLQILDAYVQMYPGKITRVVSGKQFHNAKEHFLWLMEQCQADYIQFCDQDDVWHPNKLRLLQQAMEEAEAVYGSAVPLLVFSDQAVVDRELRLIAPSFMQLQRQNPNALDYRSLLFQNVVSGCTMAINRPLARLASGCRNPWQMMMHDWWLALVAAKFGKVVYIDQTTIDYRQHSSNSVGAKDVKSLSFTLHRLRNVFRFQSVVRLQKQQALCFLERYRDALSDEEILCLRQFGAAHSPVRFKLKQLQWIDTPVRKIGFFIRW